MPPKHSSCQRNSSHSGLTDSEHGLVFSFLAQSDWLGVKINNVTPQTNARSVQEFTGGKLCLFPTVTLPQRDEVRLKRPLCSSTGNLTETKSVHSVYEQSTMRFSSAIDEKGSDKHVIWTPTLNFKLAPTLLLLLCSWQWPLTSTPETARFLW